MYGGALALLADYTVLLADASVILLTDLRCADLVWLTDEPHELTGPVAPALPHSGAAP